MADYSDYEEEEGVDEPVLSDEEEGVEEEEIEENPLTQDLIAESLSLLCKTGNGLAHAYVRLDIHARDMTDISMVKNFIHLRYVDVSQNKLKDIQAINALTHCLTLKADKNLLKTAALEELPYLQQANFSNNKIDNLTGIEHKLLETLNLNSNEITEVIGLDPAKLQRLSTIELRNNKLKSTAGLFLPNLKKIYVGENQIEKIEDLSRLEHLSTLHLRENKLTSLDGFADTMINLQYLNLRKNDISSYDEVKKLQCLPKLRALILRDNPISNEDGYRIEVLVILRKLERLDQDVFVEDERQEAEEIYNQRLEEQQQNAEGEGGEIYVDDIHSDDDN